MNQNTAVIYKPGTLKRTCMHYWVIESPNGPVSRGTCRHCGATREFNNYPTDCALEYTAFRELLGKPGQDESECNNFVEAEYEDVTATGQEDDAYERESDALSVAV